MIKQSDYENYDYREFWQDEKRLYEDLSERMALKKLLNKLEKENRVIADLGSGFGRLFPEYLGFEKIIMADYSFSNLKNARDLIKRYFKGEEALDRKVAFVVCDVARLPFKGGIIDVALSVRVVHHLPQPVFFFREVARVLKPGGFFILEFANKRNLKNILKFFFKKLKKSPFDLKPLPIGETILNWHPRYIKDSLKKLDFCLARQLSVSNFRLGILKKYINIKILVFLEKIYQTVFSFMALGPSIFLKSRYMPAGWEKLAPSVPPADFKDFFICPSCARPGLSYQPPGKIICTACKKEYAFKEGIFIFKV